jgi:hypothetical protein
MGKARKIVLGSLIAVFLLLASGAAWLYVQFERAFTPEETLPALVRGLPTKVVEIEPAFQKRVRTKFPSGTDANTLAAELKREGFTLGTREQNFGTLPPLHFAHLEHSTIVCSNDWGISWLVDDQGRAQDIRGSFGLGCL